MLRTAVYVPPATVLDGDGPIRCVIPVARLGDYSDRRYGKFSITSGQLQAWQRNLDAVFGGEAPIDYDHGPEKGRSSEAAGWITSLREATGADLQAQDPDRFAKLDASSTYAAAEVEWTPQGAQAIRDKRYRYISPTFVGNYRDETGKQLGDVMLGAALTNRAFLKRGMPAISLEGEGYTEPAAALSETTRASDSRRAMPQDELLAKLRETLSLEEDADEAKILEAAGTFVKAAAKKNEPVTPDPKAKAKTASEGDDGDTVTLSADQFAALTQGANAGEAAAKRLNEMDFDNRWEKALADGRVVPTQKEGLRQLADANHDLFVTTLDGMQQVVRTAAAGSGDSPSDRTAPDGVDSDRSTLDQDAKTLMVEDPKLSYEDAVFLADEKRHAVGA